MFNYFIFKEIMRFLRKNFKFIFVSIFLAIILLSINKNIFAMEFEYNNIGYNYPDFTEYDNFYVGKNGNAVFIWALTNNNSYFYKRGSYTAVSGTASVYGLTNNQWVYAETRTNRDIGEFSHVIGSTVSIYNDIYKNTVIFQPNISLFTNPFIVTQSNNILNWSFSDFVINCGSYNPNADFYLRYTYPDNNTVYELGLNPYKTIENNTAIISVPRSVLTSDIVVRNGSRITFTLIIREEIEGGSTVDTFDFGGYTLNLSEQQQTEINEDSNKQLLSDINQQQQQTTQAIEDLNSSQQQTTQAIDNLDDTITDSSIDNDSVFLPSDTNEDITQNGINNIFTSIYNAFCVGRPIDIVFPFPFTNTSFTLHANYLYDMLTNNNADWVINIIRLYWWYLISRFIISDISRKITKIKSGNLENIENDNIKEEML